jgi:hypothetical protein
VAKITKWYPSKGIELKSHIGICRERCQTSKEAFMKNRKNYVMTSIPTLTQSGLLAVLLQRQRRKAIELAPEHGRSLFGNYWRVLHGAAAGRLFRRGFGRTVPRHT